MQDSLLEPECAETQLSWFTRWQTNTSYLLEWRNTKNRKFWQALATFAVITESFWYLGIIFRHGTPVLAVIQCFVAPKFLVEIWGQETATWCAPGGIAGFLFIYACIVPCWFYLVGVCTANQEISFPYQNFVALAMFFGGAWFTLNYELGRFAWKKKPENKGRLHTIGPAAWCIHPNYLGDMISYSGIALAAGNWCTWSGITCMYWLFQYVVVPNSDAYLATRYSTEFPAYAAKTRTIFPFVPECIHQILGVLSFFASCYLWTLRDGHCTNWSSWV